MDDDKIQYYNFFFWGLTGTLTSKQLIRKTPASDIVIIVFSIFYTIFLMMEISPTKLDGYFAVIIWMFIL